ncbi:MAG: hypothetical protein NTX25_04475 [Proteobacteria bacterium]|nr:hypothetical protein [Pseudomonadota bacterium]
MGNLKKKIHVKVPIRKQPDDVTCGPTCLHSIYEFHQDQASLEQVIREVPMLETGGTYASKLGVHALKRGYQAEIWSFNVNIFDPTWFGLPAEQMFEKLKLQRQAKKQRKLRTASDGYMEFLQHGGILKFEDLNIELLVSCLRGGYPLIAGLSATYLYKSAREDPKSCEHNDVKGRPSGHFVVLTGIERDTNMVHISDPYFPNALSDKYTYTVSIDRLICAILLGVVTYDANLLMIYKKDGKNEEPHRS